MSTNPCEGWSRDRVESLFTTYGPFDSWAHLARTAEAEDWPVSYDDIRLTLGMLANRVDSPAFNDAFDYYVYSWPPRRGVGRTDKARMDYLFAICHILDGAPDA